MFHPSDFCEKRDEPEFRAPEWRVQEWYVLVWHPKHVPMAWHRASRRPDLLPEFLPMCLSTNRIIYVIKFFKYYSIDWFNQSKIIFLKPKLSIKYLSIPRRSCLWAWCSWYCFLNNWCFFRTLIPSTFAFCCWFYGFSIRLWYWFESSFPSFL